jgi:hypothetical protein
VKRIHSLALVLTIAAAGCSGHSNSALPADANLSGTLSSLPAAKLTVHTSSNRLHRQDWGGIPTMGMASMMDAPPLLGGVEPSEVDLAIVRIDATGDRGTATLAQFDTPYVVNVLDFQTQPLAFDAVPIAAGRYAHFTVVIDPSQSHVVLGGATLPIHFANNLFVNGGDVQPAASTSTQMDAGDVAMDVRTAMVAVAGQTNGFNIDFNAAESLALDDSHTSVIAEPVMAAADGDQGSVSGRVVNAYGGPVAHAIVVAADGKGHAGNSTITDSAGNFYLHTLSPGSYSIRIYNKYRNAAGDIVVATGQSNRSDRVRESKITLQPRSVLNVGSLTD